MKLFLLCLLGAQLVFAGGFRAGTAKVDITPELPAWLSGFAIRTHPANHVLQHLWAKALVIDAGRGQRFVVVTTDLLGLPPELSDEVALRCQERFGLRRDQLWLNSSHTHSGPVVWPNLSVIFDLNPAEKKRAEQYASMLTESLTSIVGQALDHEVPAKVFFGSGQADFAINRRLAKLQALNPGHEFPAPTDHSVPVIEVKALSGKVMAVLFGYACHNTTITGEFYEVAGDYAGYAQVSVEKSHPGAQAMFTMLCGGDQNPSPRSQIALAEQHGTALARAVEDVLGGSMTQLRSKIRSSFAYADLPLKPHRREDFEAEAHSDDIYHRRRAQLTLAAYDQGTVLRSVRLPVQTVRFGSQLTIVTIGGEVVVDYSLRVKRLYGSEKTIIAGYSNGVISYIPSERVLKEGGYEAEDSIVFYGLPAPYAEGIEERVFTSVRQVMHRVGVSEAP